MSSTGALALDKVPEHLLVIGAGSSASSSARCGGGSAPRSPWSSSSTASCRAWTAKCASQSQRMLEKQGMTFKLSSKVTGGRRIGQARSRRRSSRPDGRRRRDASRPTWCSSRSAACPTPRGSASKELGVKLDERGRVVVDEHFADQRARHLRHRRRHRRADAGAQGRGRRRRASPKSSPGRPAT